MPMHSWPKSAGSYPRMKARELILAKLYDIAHAELERYLNAEKRNTGLCSGLRICGISTR